MARYIRTGIRTVQVLEIWQSNDKQNPEFLTKDGKCVVVIETPGSKEFDDFRPATLEENALADKIIESNG